MQKNIGDFDSLDAALLAISVDPQATGRAMKDALKLTFPLLSDTKAEVIRKYGVVDPILGISKPAVFILDKEGVIRWKQVGANLSDRAPTATILAEIRKTLTPAFPKWDIDKSGSVDILDLVAIARRFGAFGGGLTEDIDGNGSVDIADLVTVALHFGE